MSSEKQSINMLDSEAHEQMKQLYESACEELFVGLNCHVQRCEGGLGEIEEPLIACIDAGSDELEIKIALEMPLGMLAMTYPVPNVMEVKEEDLEDWGSELSNQLIGRFKTKLLRHKLDILLGLPVSYLGLPLEKLLDDDEGRFSVYLDVDGEPCAFHMTVEYFNSEIDFSSEQAPEDGLLESEIELF